MTSNTYTVYQFEAVSIQEYIMASSKLKEMVGASQLLESLTTDILDKVVSQIELTELTLDKLTKISQINEKNIFFARRAGGVFLAVLKTSAKAEEFKQLWPLIVQQIAPGLKFSVASANNENIKDAIKEVREKLNTEKNTPKVRLPEMTPITMRSPRTGLSSVTTEQGVSIDFPTVIKRKTQHEAKQTFSKVANKWLPKGIKRDFPNVFDHTRNSDDETQFPFSGQEGEHTVAIVHADGNGVGQYIMDFFKKITATEVTEINFLKAYAQFSQGMDRATVSAAQQAMQFIINKTPENSALPIRPLILSGDDVTCIIRADYAFEFMRKLTIAFEKESKKELDEIEFKTARDAFPNKLTITTGIAFLRSNQPFYMGYQLAESLCGLSKELGRKSRKKDTDEIPSTISFVHSTSTLFENAQDYIKAELTSPNGIKLTNELYFFGETNNTDLVDFNQLQKLTGCFKNLNISFIRKLATTLQTDPEHAKQMINRWIEINNERDIQNLNDNLAKFNGLTLTDLATKNSPISDLIAYQSLTANNGDTA